MIFVDSNVPMYLVGAPHPHKADAQRLVERFAVERISMVTDAEVFQEVLHRYAAIGRQHAIRPAFDWLLDIADEVFPVELDALHVAVMLRHGVDRIMSFDAGFDNLRGISRVSD